MGDSVCTAYHKHSTPIYQWAGGREDATRAQLSISITGRRLTFGRMKFVSMEYFVSNEPALIFSSGGSSRLPPPLFPPAQAVVNGRCKLPVCCTAAHRTMRLCHSGLPAHQESHGSHKHSTSKSPRPCSKRRECGTITTYLTLEVLPQCEQVVTARSRCFGQSQLEHITPRQMGQQLKVSE